ncbi:MAG: hypothetical protein QXX08_06685 [Candidatus Bathyarchaeia archaeon]
MKRSRLDLETRKSRMPRSSLLNKEKCLNPWNKKCESTDIAIYIMYEGEQLPICRDCWAAISAKNIEWLCG